MTQEIGILAGAVEGEVRQSFGGWGVGQSRQDDEGKRYA